jgi:hypothetical protein
LGGKAKNNKNPGRSPLIMLLLAVSGGLYVVPEFLYISASFERY